MAKAPDKAELLRRKIKSRQALYDYSNSQMGVKMHTSERTYTRHLCEIESLKVRDLLKLEKALHMNLLDVSVGIEQYTK